MKANTLLGGALALAMTAIGGAALAEYPEKPVNFIVPWPPGDLEDVLTRMIAEDFQKEYDVAAAVVNKVTYYTTIAAAKATCIALDYLEHTDVNKLQDLHKEVAA